MELGRKNLADLSSPEYQGRKTTVRDSSIRDHEICALTHFSGVRFWSR